VNTLSRGVGRTVSPVHLREQERLFRPVAQRLGMQDAARTAEVHAQDGNNFRVEPFHLFRYLDEQAFRFNNRRDMNGADRFSRVITGIVGKRLTYQDLIGALSAATRA
jgi:hypothetical protein